MADCQPPYRANLILRNPLWNKGTAFTQKERDLLGLNGLLPYHVSTLEEQALQRYRNFQAQTSDLAKYLFLDNLRHRNEVLFYKLVSDHISEMMPLIYTPTVGDVSLHFSSLYTEAKGLYLSYPHRDKMEKIFDSLPSEPIEVIVVTDGERILGLGDLGAGGMAIPLGKLTLYTLFGGINPARTLPIALDVGTNNQALLDDPLYLGWRHHRIDEKAYDQFIDQFVQVVSQKYPDVLLQWEDFGNRHARPLLERYKEKICSFNDDIQGTASVVLAAILSATKRTGKPLREQKIVIFGGGSAGTGIAERLIGAMISQGIELEEARETIYLIDIQGLVTEKIVDLPSHQKPFSRREKEVKSWKVNNPGLISLFEVVREVHPTILLGVSAQKGAFTQEIIEEMAKHVDHPIIFPLSNPSSRSEADPQQIVEWTEAKAIVATGSPFAEVVYRGKKIPIPQCNNVYIYPGVGLGVVASKARKVSEKMFYRAAEVLSSYSSNDSLFPPFEKLHAISREIALAVLLVAQEEGLSSRNQHEATAEQMIDQVHWKPFYHHLSIPETI